MPVPDCPIQGDQQTLPLFAAVRELARITA
jgi:hypothetical protein